MDTCAKEPRQPQVEGQMFAIESSLCLLRDRLEILYKKLTPVRRQQITNECPKEDKNEAELAPLAKDLLVFNETIIKLAESVDHAIRETEL